MSNTTVSRKNPANMKGNKENAEPRDKVKSVSRRDFSKSTSNVSTQFKSNKKLVGSSASTIQDAKSASIAVVKKGKSTQKDGNKSAVCEIKQRQTHKQAILTERTVKNGKVVPDTTRAPAAATSSKVVPGMYKGKIVESKIGSIWKSSTTARKADSKPAAPKTTNQKVADLTRRRSKSAADVPEHQFLKPAPPRSKSQLDGRAQASKTASTARPWTSSTVPATLKTSRNTTVAPTKAKIAVTDQKVKRPPVTSTLSQYRCTETTEERRAKLAVWLASKGKTLKRPATTSTQVVPKISTSVKPKASVKSKSKAQLDEAKPGPSLDRHKPDSTASGPPPQAQEAPISVQTPLIMNTSFDLMENSDFDLPVVQDGFDDVILNLCDVLETMPTPSKCQDEEEKDATEDDECVKEASKKLEAKEILKDEGEKKMMDEDVQCDDTNVEGTSETNHGYVIKYNVKTTPYLQSIKKTIEGEAQIRTSTRKSNIRDVKFLTPVRRSRRIESKSLHLPSTLLDHDQSVSSLAELVTMDGDLNAYVYRNNSALMGNLPDHVKA
ncbi:cytoskeleton-associated protein 2 isoform X2 [Syngnathus scovelli]|uniref:cytoskeleton-associated protein 2 isoform X2 n=1 Tax=Syngnathus scovelli TaxID=161590 RepID=UPI00210FABB4|nr:cytoskeleton-associated protein 2 isoform X2 [Syngnathus scovelli]